MEINLRNGYRKFGISGCSIFFVRFLGLLSLLSRAFGASTSTSTASDPRLRAFFAVAVAVAPLQFRLLSLYFYLINFIGLPCQATRSGERRVRQGSQGSARQSVVRWVGKPACISGPAHMQKPWHLLRLSLSFSAPWQWLIVASPKGELRQEGSRTPTRAEDRVRARAHLQFIGNSLAKVAFLVWRGLSSSWPRNSCTGKNYIGLSRLV